MDPDFKFEAESSGEESEGEQGAPQSPWEFAAYSESVAEEHARRNTTSVDAKINRARIDNSVSLPDNEDEEEEEEEEEEELEEEEEEEAGDEIDDAVAVDSTMQESQNIQDIHGETIGEGGRAFFASSEGASFFANSFRELNLSRPLLRACEALGYYKPTPIQAACIPLALTGRGVCGSALTGSGKTAAFALPVLERFLFRPKNQPGIRVLFLAPTRELAVQVHSMIEKLAQFTDIRCCLVVGGLSTKVQEAALRSRPDIVVANPGRIIGHLRNSVSVGLEDLSILIFDEADRLLEFGFNGEIKELFRFMRPRSGLIFLDGSKKSLEEGLKAYLEQNKSGPKEVMSAQRAEELKLKEKRRREREKNLPRKKRRRLEAAREMLEDEVVDNDTERSSRGGMGEKTGKSLVDVAYRRAKSMKSVMKARESGKTLKNSSKRAKQDTQKNQTRKEEMLDLFQSDMTEGKQARIKTSNPVGKKKKSSFKSKSRYKRRK